MKEQRWINIALDLRPIFQGYYGIPQATRTLLQALLGNKDFRVMALFQRSRVVDAWILRRALADPAQLNFAPEHVVKHTERFRLAFFSTYSIFRLYLAPFSRALAVRTQTVKARRGAALVDLLLAACADRRVVCRDGIKDGSITIHACIMPYRWMHDVGRFWGNLGIKHPYPKVVLPLGADVFIAQTPFPGHLPSGIRLIVHYHDAIPLTHVATTLGESRHSQLHLAALRANVRAGAHFVCPSESVRIALLTFFPDIGDRIHVIPNMVPDHFNVNPEPFNEAILNTYRLKYLNRQCYSYCKISPATLGDFGMSRHISFFMMVATIEPRKNHAVVFRALELLRKRLGYAVPLVIVGNLGWRYNVLLDGICGSLQSGEVVMLCDVDPHALKSLYQNACATICPSLQEGFDYSGAEAMRCGGMVVASDIEVHREICGRAAFYFPVNDAERLAEVLVGMLGMSCHSEKNLEKRAAGIDISQRYTRAAVEAQWYELLASIVLDDTST